jgi:hypothetical protein
MRTLLVAGLLTVAAAVPEVASAGTYIGLGIGTGPNTSDSQNNNYSSDGRSGRLAVGFAFGRLAVEGAYSGYSAVIGDTRSMAGQFDSRTLQVALKYNLPLADHFELFGRGGLLRTDLSWKDGGGSWSGDGYTLSAGVEYRLPAFGSLFVDVTRNQASLDNGSPTAVDQTASMFTLGVNISL